MHTNQGLARYQNIRSSIINVSRGNAFIVKTRSKANYIGNDAQR